MQSLVRTAILLAMIQIANAVILRVPQEYATIQSGLDASEEHDTVLVSVGVYSETLISPAHSFTLMGDVVPDTGDYPRPIIDPSLLPNPRSRNCLSVGTFGVPVVQYVRFRNGPEMFPRSEQSLSGGVVNNNTSLVLKHCVFDSVYIGVQGNARTHFESCMFIDCINACIDLNQSQLIALDCEIAGNSGGWGLIRSGGASLLERCLITDHGVGATIYWPNADSSEMRSCIFHDLAGMTSSPVFISGANCRIDSCVFQNCIIHAPLVSIQSPCESSSFVRATEFLDNYCPFDWEWSTRLCITASHNGEGPNCEPIVIQNCVFRDGMRERGAAGINVAEGAMVLRNRFLRLNGAPYGACQLEDRFVSVHENYFDECRIALTTSANTLIDAEYNFWGDSTGPHHPVSNPLGQGDEVGDSIDFTPWYMDTLFLSVNPERQLPLPDRATLVAYPNPFNSETTLEFTVPRAMIARVEVYDVLGRRVAELWNRPAVGTEPIRWNAAGLPSGIYFVRAWDPLGNRPLALTKIVLLR